MKQAHWLSKEEKDRNDIDSIVEKINQPVIFLFGAGASAGAGLPTMTAFLKEEYGEDFITSLDKATAYKWQAQNVANADNNQLELLKMLFQLANIDRKTVCYDLEVVFELIHKIQGFISSDAEASKKLIALFQICAQYQGRTFPDFKKVCKSVEKNLSAWFEETMKVITALREKMYARYLVEDVSPKIINTWQNYNSLFSKSNIDKAVIFTTNYDTVFETLHDHGQMDFELVNGVRPKRRRWVFELANYLKADVVKPLYLFKLHGSVSWERKNGDVFDYYPLRQRISAISTLRKPLGIIEPVLSKSESVPPFSHMYSIFEKMIDRTQTCICIGLSFRDTNLYKLVTSALEKRKQFKLICVSPDEKESDIAEVLDINENLSKLKKQHKNAIWIKDYFREGPVINRIAREAKLRSPR